MGGIILGFGFSYLIYIGFIKPLIELLGFLEKKLGVILFFLLMMFIFSSVMFYISMNINFYDYECSFSSIPCISDDLDFLNSTLFKWTSGVGAVLSLLTFVKMIFEGGSDENTTE